MDKYEKIRFLSEGGYGKAFLYRRLEDDAQVVVKVIDPHQLEGRDRQTVGREVEALKKLSNANIVRYMDSFKDDHKICIVMEYCNKGDLYHRVSTDTSIHDQLRWQWFIQICKALEFMHSCKVIHRDLTHRNIFVTHDDTLKVGDFGLVKIYMNSLSLVKSAALVGTITFNAPEMLSDDTYSSKCDVWALGCILYFMITRKEPFFARNAVTIMANISRGKYDPIQQTVSEDLRRTVTWLLTVDPRQRPNVKQVLDSQAVQRVAQPTYRLQATYGLSLHGGVLKNSVGKRFSRDFHNNRWADKIRYDGVLAILTEYLFQLMLDLGLKKLPVPQLAGGSADFDSTGTFIFATPNWNTCQHLLILIHGSGGVKAGQWTRRKMVYSSFETGTQLPYIRKALDRGYGVMVLNTNDNKPGIEGCESPTNHALYVWRKYVKVSMASKIAIKSHSAGGDVVAKLFEKYPEDFETRVFANAFTGSGAISLPVRYYTKKVTRNWLASDQPLGAALSSNGGFECISAGTNDHSNTPHQVFPQVFQFIAQRFDETTPRGL